MSENTLQHIGIIMDGNGRWAKNRGLPRTKGHREGVKALERTLDYAFENGVRIVSVFAFSTENWSRPKSEIRELFSILKTFIKSRTKKMIQDNIRLMVMGSMTELPPSLVEAVDTAMKNTAHCTGHIFNIGLNYGSRPELLTAVNRIISDKVEHVDEKIFNQYLYTKDIPDPDLIIRTSGEQRLSNFMLYQAAYSELYFSSVYWPDFDGAELKKAIDDFHLRKRRFGKI